MELSGFSRARSFVQTLGIPCFFLRHRPARLVAAVETNEIRFLIPAIGNFRGAGRGIARAIYYTSTDRWRRALPSLADRARAQVEWLPNM